MMDKYGGHRQTELGKTKLFCLNILTTTENSLDLSPILFTPPTSQVKTAVFSCRWCKLDLTEL